MAVIGFGAIWVAMEDSRVVFWFVLYAWSGLGAAFGPLILGTLYARNLTKAGALAGMITGFLVTVGWKAAGWSDSIVYELVPAFALGGAALMLVSRLTGGSHVYNQNPLVHQEE